MLVAVAVTFGLLGGCTQPNSATPDAYGEPRPVPAGERRPAPELDGAVPDGLETAVFGLG